jgi:aryl-alcohol dehydrogenase-like predicted oxidoreductase
VKERYLNERGFAILDQVDVVAKARGLTPAQVSLAWLLSQPIITAPIVGANSVAQLSESLAACEVRLTAEEMAVLSEASASEE